jgi:arabinofuranosyltransferase
VNRILTITKIGFVLLGLYAVVSRMWAAEDAYITFRYIDNLLHGYGLVYNVGDRVEGFTHPLWLFLITIPAWLGVSVRAGALLISLILSGISLYLLAFRDRDSQGNAIAVPLGLALVLTHTGFRDFSVSGLEFPLVCLLLVCFYQSYKQNDLLGRPWLHGSLLACLYLTRPELILLILSFYVVLAWQVMEAYRNRAGGGFAKLWKEIARFSAPIFVLAGGYHLFRYVYYDAFFPNTYYAKDGLGAYWSAGITYFLHFWHYSPILLTAVLAWAILIITRPDVRRDYLGSQPRVVMLAQAGLLSIYVMRLGGDFMAYRFMLPAMMILVVLLNDLVRYLPMTEQRTRSIGAVLLTATALLVVFPISAPQSQGYIADERQVYDLYHPAYRALFDEPVEHKWYKQGMGLRESQERIGYPISVVDGNIGYFGFAAGPKVTIVDMYGLVDREVARTRPPGRERGRPGHERKLNIMMAIDRRVTICPTPFKEWNRIMGTPFGTIITLDTAFLRNFPERVASLKEYKRQVTTGEIPADESFGFLQLLEEKYKIRIEDL